MPTRWPSAWLLVEGGGSRTWVAIVGERTTQLAGASTNVVTMPENLVRQHLRDLLNSVLNSAGVSLSDIGLVLAAHGAASTQRSAEKFADFLYEILKELTVRAQLIVTNDMVPVITSDQGEAVVAAIVGTGTGYAAHRGLRNWARAGGADYILSDEGGGFDLAMCGLRAAIRATDGRGPPTDLTTRARQWVGASDRIRLSDALFERVYVAYPRSVVADFARWVIDAAQDGDQVAHELIELAADEVLVGVRTVAERAGIAEDSPRLVMSGSLATVETPMRRAILARLRQQLSPSVVTNYEPEDLATKAAGVVRLLRNGGLELEELKSVFPVSIRPVGIRQ